MYTGPWGDILSVGTYQHAACTLPFRYTGASVPITMYTGASVLPRCPYAATIQELSNGPQELPNGPVCTDASVSSLCCYYARITLIEMCALVHLFPLVVGSALLLQNTAV